MGAKFDPLLGQLRTTDVSGGGSGTVTSVAVTGANGIGVSGSPVTSSGTVALSLGAITPSTVNGVTVSGSSTPTLAVTGTSSISGTNTGDQTNITGNAGTVTTNANLTGPVTSVGNATSIASNIALPGSPTTTTQSPSDNSTKLATTAYTDLAVAAAVQGLSIKQSVQEATTAPLPINTYLAGVITITATGVLTVDSQTVNLNDRVLVKDEVAQANNGIYLCTTAGAVGVAAVLTRATDSNTSAKILGGYAFVELGTVNADAGFVNTNTSTITIGITAITYTQFNSRIAAAGSTTQIQYNNGGTFAADSALTRDSTGTQFHIGAVAAGTTNANVGGQGVEIAGSDNTNGGMNLIASNSNAGVNAFVDIFLQNNLANSGGTHFAVLNLNSSTYTYTGFGTIIAVPNQLALYGTDGPTSIGTAAASYINFFVGGTATANEVARLTTSGLTLATPLAVAQGGTGSATQNFVDLSSTQASIAGAKTFTSNTTFSSGLMTLSNGTSNRLTLSAVGVGAPTFTTVSGGEKITLFSAISGSAVDYAIGVESFYQWFSTPTSIATGGWKWYAGTTLVATLTGQGVLSLPLEIQTNQAITVTTNAGTADVIHGTQTFTNSSAAAMTITLTTTSAADGQKKIVRIYDFSAVAQAITWVNTENSAVTVPTISNGSTTLPLTVGFMYNSATSKWRCMAVT